MPAFSYGGQALIEGVLMRGRTALAVALRHPDGSIVWATERLDQGLRARRVLRLPLVRGLVLLYDTLVTGTRWLVRSATVAAAGMIDESGTPPGVAGGAGGADGAGGVGGAAAPGGPGGSSGLLGLIAAPLTFGGAFAGSAMCAALPEGSPSSPSGKAPAADTGLGRGFGIAVGMTLIVTMVVAIGIFFIVPLFLASITVGRVDQGFGLQITEGLIRVALFVGYLLLVARTPDVQRVFRYHGAEHMSIHALEHGDPLTTEAVRKYPTAHPRCGTEFLVVVLIVSILAFALVGKQSPVWMIASRIALIPVIAAISYELLQFGAKRRRFAIVRVLWSPGIWVQKVTTKQPSDDMIEVAIVSLERALAADGQQVPAGSAMFPSRPMSGELPADEAAYEPALDETGQPIGQPPAKPPVEELA